MMMMMNTTLNRRYSLLITVFSLPDSQSEGGWFQSPVSLRVCFVHQACYTLDSANWYQLQLSRSNATASLSLLLSFTTEHTLLFCLSCVVQQVLRLRPSASATSSSTHSLHLVIVWYVTGLPARIQRVNTGKRFQATLRLFHVC